MDLFLDFSNSGSQGDDSQLYTPADLEYELDNVLPGPEERVTGSLVRAVASLMPHLQADTGGSSQQLILTNPLPPNMNPAVSRHFDSFAMLRSTLPCRTPIKETSTMSGRSNRKIPPRLMTSVASKVPPTTSLLPLGSSRSLTMLSAMMETWISSPQTHSTSMKQGTPVLPRLVTLVPFKVPLIAMLSHPEGQRLDILQECFDLLLSFQSRQSPF